jgi:hypothetical protein
MSLWSKIKGTAESAWQIGLGGPLLKNNGGVIEGRNAADSAFAVMRGATAVSGNDLVAVAGEAAAHSEMAERAVLAATAMRRHRERAAQHLRRRPRTRAQAVGVVARVAPERAVVRALQAPPGAVRKPRSTGSPEIALG